MADVFEDFPQEADSLNYMDSGNASSNDDEDESDYESRLYSLVHYSEESGLKGEEEISKPDVFAYVSKGTKVSRLNPVKNIIADSSFPFDDMSCGPTYSNRKKSLNNENYLRNLIHAYKNTASDFSHSTPIKNNSSPLINAYASLLHTNKKTSHRREKQFEENRGKVSESIIDISSRNESVSCVRKIDNIGSKSRSFDYENHLEHGAGSSKSHFKHNGEIAEDGRISRPKKQKSGRKKDKSRVLEISADEELNSSKYNMELDRKKTSTPSKERDISVSKYTKHKKDNTKNLNEKVIVLDDSDSNSSILEMETPVKEPPPVVVLSSEDEDKVVKTDPEDDIVVLYSGGEKPGPIKNRQLNVNKSSNENKQGNEEKAAKKKSKKKKKKRESTLRSFSSQGISPSSWTQNMSHFYNDSWGGEDFDGKSLQNSMTSNRTNWFVLASDFNRNTYQRNIKCQNCNHYGHRARACAMPQKRIVCLFCGIEGHVQTKCPSTICLRCGKPSRVYHYGCNICSFRNNNIPCNVCKLTDHPAADCPEIWRRYHSTTTEEDLSSEVRTEYKPAHEQHCSNCAKRGHQYHECNESRQQGNWQKRSNSSFTGQNMHAKRRKLDKNAQKRLNHRVHPLLSYFQPLYERYM